jgi:hypothetical protein
MSKIELLRLFKENLSGFLETLTEQFPKENDFKILKIIVRDQMPVEESLKIFSKTILPYSQMVLSKDDTFFLEKCGSILGGFDVNSNKVDHFKRIWTSGQLDDEDKENLWMWFKLFLNIAEQYSKL